MRFHTVIAVLFFSGILAVSIHEFVRISTDTVKQAEELRMAFYEKKFIAESFRKTCEGKGFSSLEEWQLCCRQMFNLEYIGWCSSDEFMIDPFATENNVLMYGKWICPGTEGSLSVNASGEVYCRMTGRKN